MTLKIGEMDLQEEMKGAKNFKNVRNARPPGSHAKHFHLH
jgi:hypothetical protein